MGGGGVCVFTNILLYAPARGVERSPDQFIVKSCNDFITGEEVAMHCHHCNHVQCHGNS